MKNKKDPDDDSDVLIEVSHVSKKFSECINLRLIHGFAERQSVTHCRISRNLKRSTAYDRSLVVKRPG